MNLSESYKKRLLELAGLSEIDYFRIGDKDYDTGDVDAVPFLYYDEVLYLDYPGGSHWDIASDIVADKIKKGEYDESETWQEYESEVMDNSSYNGRIWKDSKIISFWKMPEGRFILKDIVDDLNERGNGDFNIDGSWQIRVGDNNGKNDKLISLKDYTGGEISDAEKKDLEDKWKQHIMSPLEKNKRGLTITPKGWGSTHKDYSGHRTWDRAIGRAQ